MSEIDSGDEEEQIIEELEVGKKSYNQKIIVI